MLRAVFFATRMEAEHVLAEKSFGYRQICAEPFRVWRNDKNIIIVTGIGLVNASLGFAWAVRKYKFDDALNIGAVGATITDKDRGPSESIMGKVYKISKVVCLEPYNEKVFKLGRSGKALVTSSRPVSTREERIYAGKFAPLVDMEGYAFARAAEIYSKNISMVKMVTDFSHECDIFDNIRKMAERFAAMKDIWI